MFEGYLARNQMALTDAARAYLDWGAVHASQYVLRDAAYTLRGGSPLPSMPVITSAAITERAEALGVAADLRTKGMALTEAEPALTALLPFLATLEGVQMDDGARSYLSQMVTASGHAVLADVRTSVPAGGALILPEQLWQSCRTIFRNKRYFIG